MKMNMQRFALVKIAPVMLAVAVVGVSPTFAADTDGDGVDDTIDVCSDTFIPELIVPTDELKPGHFALTDSDTTFNTGESGPGGGIVESSLTTADTAGCSCEQIIEELQLGLGNEKFGCGFDVIEEFQKFTGLLPTTPLLATGQLFAFAADKNDGIVGLVLVIDDGILRLGAPLRYLDTGLTVIDLNTGLEWDKKLAADGSDGGSCDDGNQANRDLHCVNNFYRWSGNGSQETIWDWLDDINTEGGTGYAGFNDWRIPNLRELLSIVDYGRRAPAIDPTFGPTFVQNYWTSTTAAEVPLNAWSISFLTGFSNNPFKTAFRHVRAVRGGCEVGITC